MILSSRLRYAFSFLAALIAMSVYIAECSEYGVVYIVSNSKVNPLELDTIVVEQKNRHNTAIKMNEATRLSISKYIQADSRQGSKEPSSTVDIITDSKSLPSRNAMIFTKTAIPQYLWIDDKQLVIVEIDLASLVSIQSIRNLFNASEQIQGTPGFQLLQSSAKKDAQVQEIVARYEGILKHKGSSTLIFDSMKLGPESAVLLQILFNVSSPYEQVCAVELHSDLESNKELIQKCYLESQSNKRSARLVHRINWGSAFGEFVLYYGAFMLVGTAVVLGHPAYVLWLERKHRGSIAAI